MLKYTFIIPLKEINDYFREAVSHILEIKRDDFEIIVCPDRVSSEEWKKTRQIATGPVGPAKKRNLAAKKARGAVLIFIDDDAYPAKNFLSILDQDFKKERIRAVGGPAITPPQDGFWQKVSGAAFLSGYGGGCPERYRPLGSKRFVDDWPSVNFSVRREDFIAVGGFDERYWPGEDTRFCLDLLKKRKARILYDPRLIVYHHRRRNLAEHLKQVRNYGLHRGFFAKKFPQNSLKFKYFLPSFLFLFFVVGGGGSIFSGLILKLYLVGSFLYLLVLLKAGFDIYKFQRNFFITLNALYYIFFTHLAYGIKFLQGLVLTKELKSTFR